MAGQRLNSKLLRAALRAGAMASGDNPPEETENDEDETASEDEDTSPPAGRKSKRARKSRAEDERDENTAEDEDESAEDDDESAEDEEADDEEPKGRKSKRARKSSEDDETAEDDDESAEEDDESAEDDEEPKGRRGRKASGERARIAAITRSALAAGREDLADFLAFDTDLTSRMALKILKHAPKAKSSRSLNDRMADIGNPDIRTASGKRNGNGGDDTGSNLAAFAQAQGY